MTDYLAKALEHAGAAASGEWPPPAQQGLFYASWLAYLQGLSQRVQVVDPEDGPADRGEVQELRQALEQVTALADERDQQLQQARRREQATFDSLGHAKALISAIRHTVAESIFPSAASDVKRMIAEAERQGRI